MNISLTQGTKIVLIVNERGAFVTDQSTLALKFDNISPADLTIQVPQSVIPPEDPIADEHRHPFELRCPVLVKFANGSALFVRSHSAGEGFLCFLVQILERFEKIFHQGTNIAPFTFNVISQVLGSSGGLPRTQKVTKATQNVVLALLYPISETVENGQCPQQEHGPLIKWPVHRDASGTIRHVTVAADNVETFQN
jgi:hypothetical protein